MRQTSVLPSSVLDIQLDTKLHIRQGQAITNFDKTLPSPQAELAQETLKDPYIFDFLTMTTDKHELDLERQLTNQIIKFLLELGNGFAFIGRQYPLKVGEKEYALDLLFYHYKSFEKRYLRSKLGILTLQLNKILRG